MDETSKKKTLGTKIFFAVVFALGLLITGITLYHQAYAEKVTFVPISGGY